MGRKFLKLFLVVMLISNISVLVFQDFKTSSNSYCNLRRSSTISPSFSVLNLMGAGLENLPSFEEGLAIFREALSVRLSQEQIDELSFFVLDNLSAGDYLEASGVSETDAEAFLQMAMFYTSGVRRDQVDIGNSSLGCLVKMLRSSDIKPLVEGIEQAIEIHQAENGGDFEAEIEELRENLKIATHMVGLWLTSPISPKPIFEAVRGGNTAVMAVNPRFPQTTAAVMVQAMEDEALVSFELAMSECNHTSQDDIKSRGYAVTGTPEDAVDSYRYWAYVLGYDRPYFTHIDHGTVKQDTPEAEAYTAGLINAYVEASARYGDGAGVTAVAIDPSSLVAVGESTQLGALNSMTREDFISVLGIGDVLADRLVSYGEFRKLEDLKNVDGIGPQKIHSIMEYVESKILTPILNSLLEDDTLFVDILSQKFDSADVAERIRVHGEFSSLYELAEIEGVDRVIDSIEADKLNPESEVDATYSRECTILTYIKDYVNLNRVNELNLRLAQASGIPVIENENGHIGAKDPVTGEQKLTTWTEVIVTLDFLHAHGFYPLVIATHNGSSHGYEIINGQRVASSVDVQRTRELSAGARSRGADLAQHGGSGNSQEVWRDVAGYILKANVATFYMYKCLETIPETLFMDMAEWTVDTFGKEGQFDSVEPLREFSREEILSHPVYAKFLNSYIKKSIVQFKDRINSLRLDEIMPIIDANREGAAQWFVDFNATSRVQDVVDLLGWGWDIP